MAEGIMTGREFTQESRRKSATRNEKRKKFFDRYEWQFVLLGLFGNFLFFVGSVLFLNERTETAGIWLFIVGSCLMLVSSSASSIAEYARSRMKSMK